jgi:hypothetical protein
VHGICKGLAQRQHEQPALHMSDAHLMAH